MPAPVLFLAFAQDPARFLPRLADELRGVRDTLEQAEKQGLCRLVLRSNATLDEIFQIFQDNTNRDRIALFHFAGHGDATGLLLETSGGGADWADARGLAAFLGQQRNLQAVILNACSTQQHAQSLLDSGAPCVIATRYDIADEHATAFSSRFYHALAQGIPLARAFSEAKAAVVARWGEPERFAWEIFYKPGAEPETGQWNLPDAAGDFLFGLPPLPENIDLPDKPFRHLHWFEREHAQVFFGRGQAIRDLYQRVTDPAGEPLILLYGQSGVGKSSLLAAGLLPRLERDWEPPRYLRREAELGLLGTLEKVFTAETQSAQREDSAFSSASSAPLRLNLNLEKPRIIILDQAEEAYTRPHSSHELEDFLAALPGLLKEIKIILGFRKEWLAEIEKQLNAHRLPYQRVFLDSLDRAGIIEAVTGPTRSERLSERLRRKFGLSIEDGLAERIADALNDPAAAIAPTLQILLGKLWDKATETDAEQPRFSLALYETLERDGILLQDFLDQQLAQLAHSHPAESASGLVLDILALHTTPLGTAAALPRAELERLYAHQTAVLPDLLQACQDLYLLTIPATRQANQPAVSRLAHDTLAPLIRQGFDESDKPGQRARRVLENRGLEWQDGKTGAPLDDTDLALVENGREGMRAWTGDEGRLISASIARRTAQYEEKRRNQRRWTLFVLGFFIVALGLSSVAAWFWQASEEKFTQSIINQSHMLAGFAEFELNKDKPATAMRLALEALPSTSESHPERPLVEPAYDSLFRATNRQYQGVFEHDFLIQALFSPDSKRLLTCGRHSVYLWDMETHQLLHRLHGHEFPINSAAFSHDGKHVVIASGLLDIGAAYLWDSDTGKEIMVLNKHEQSVNSAAFSANGERIVTASSDHTARLWDVATGKELAVLRGHESGVNSGVFSDDGSRIVTTSWDKTARLWDAATGKELAVLRVHEKDITSVAFSADSRRIVTTSRDKTARLWDADMGKELAMLRGHESDVNSAIFSADGRRIVTASMDKTARLWDSETGRELAVLRGHESGVNSAIFTADDRRIVTTSMDKTARLWDANTGKGLVVLHGHAYEDWTGKGLSESIFATYEVTAIPATISSTSFAVFSPNSKHIATALLGDNATYLWNLNMGVELMLSENASGWLSITSIDSIHTRRQSLERGSLEELVTYAQKMLPPRDSENPGDAGIPGWRLTCAERRRFFLPEVERCSRSAKP